ncbi:hypothetical protein SAMN06265375_1011348 [Muriicola jejuensis]|uniref:Uncharacterized protein n=1 Tax=Muriicola jejuensis TaxID=504488 RepID=A0A6P0UGB8_9FLAO|nr:hypothetical protein [Muriicola jejuensis]NER09166.1 hypothetical protein [Muriicola jejuensis]SMP10702.1 hypothetical protein SAMN06265375_1011348 [Muriicola jejuensis]
MNSNKKSFILFILFIWSVYFAWSLDVSSAVQTYSKGVTRYDLLLLPFLIVFTGYSIYLLVRKQDSDRN